MNNDFQKAQQLKKSVATRAPFHFAGVDIQNPDRDRSFDLILNASKEKPVRVSWINASCANILRQDSDYLEATRAFEFVMNDGAGIEIAARVLDYALSAGNLNGTDWIPDLLNKLNHRKGPYQRVFLFGATAKSSQAAAKRFPDQWPNLVLAGHHCGFYDHAEQIIRALKQAQAEVLIVGTGVPRQEKFIYAHWNDIEASGIRVAIAGGAIIDRFAGEVARAPLILQKMRMEWLFRLLREPRRLWRRYLIGNLVFFWYLFFDWLKHKN